MKINKEQVVKVCNQLGLDYNSQEWTLDDLVSGSNIELEHGEINPATNVTNDDIVKTVKIALAHLNETPLYYDDKMGLESFEEKLKAKASTKNKFTKLLEDCVNDGGPGSGRKPSGMTAYTVAKAQAYNNPKLASKYNAQAQKYFNQFTGAKEQLAELRNKAIAEIRNRPIPNYLESIRGSGPDDSIGYDGDGSQDLESRMRQAEFYEDR